MKGGKQKRLEGARFSRRRGMSRVRSLAPQRSRRSFGASGVPVEGHASAAESVAAWFRLRADDHRAAAVMLHALRRRAVRIVASRCRCGITVADDHVADAVFAMAYGIRRIPQLRIAATSTLAYLCGVARNEWRWSRWRRAREADAEAERLRFVPIREHGVRSSPGP